ncbi:glycoside hydrolase family 6 protein, partial [Streptomyces sp. NPDC054829]
MKTLHRVAAGLACLAAVPVWTLTSADSASAADPTTLTSRVAVHPHSSPARGGGAPPSDARAGAVPS